MIICSHHKTFHVWLQNVDDYQSIKKKTENIREQSIEKHMWNYH